MAGATRTLFFELGWLGPQSTSAAYVARLGKARVPLTACDDTQRALHGATHVAAGLPADAHVGLLRVYGPPVDGFPSLAAMAVVTPDTVDTLGVADTARALVYLDPTIAVLEPVGAGAVLGHITRADGLDALVDGLGFMGADWCRPEALVGDDGQPIVGPRGAPLHRYVLADGVFNSAAQPRIASKARVYSDPGLRGVRWDRQDGVGCIDMASSDGPRPEAALATAAASPATGGYHVALQDAGPDFGLSAEVVGLTDDLVLTVKLTNSFIRHISVFVRFDHADGTAMVVPDNVWTTIVSGATRAIVADWLHAASAEQIDRLLGDGHNTLKWLGTIGPEKTFLGIPVGSSGHGFSFGMPSGQGPVGRIRVFAGSLGTSSGNAADPDAAWLGIALTALIDLALPTFALITTAGVESNSLFDSIFKDKKLLLTLAYRVCLLVQDIIDAPSNVAGDLASLFTSLASTLVTKVLTSAECMAEIAGIFGAEEAEEAIPIVGWALKALAMQAAVEQLAQTIGEVIASPRVVEFDLTITMNVRITLAPDPDTGGEFPSTATRYTVTACYSDSTSRRHSGTLGDTKVARISIDWLGVPVGGEVSFIVALFSAEGWLVGKGRTQSMPNQINRDEPGGGVLAVQIPVSQKLYPLGPDTRYHHSQRLAYGAEGYAWTPTTAAPSETRQALGTGPRGHVLESLDSLTLSDDLGVLGYSWGAAGLGIEPVGGGEVITELHTMQSIGFKPIEGAKRWPEAGYMHAMAGYASPPILLFTRTVHGVDAVAGGPRCFFLDPHPGRDGGYHLRAVTPVVDPAVPFDDPRRVFDAAAKTSWGRFAWRPTSMAIHANGYVLGVSPDVDNIAILRLPAAAAPDGEVVWAARPLGPGTVAGRVSRPALVAMRPDQIALVLEAGNRRVQAFSKGGHPVPAFDGGAYWFDIVDRGALGDVSYLSLSVDVADHAYVLSQIGNGYATDDYWLDVYTPTGALLFSQQGLVAARLAVDLWRNVYTLNFEQVAGPGARTEPTLSEYIPSTPKPGR